MEEQPNSLMMEIFNRIMKGEVLSDYDRKQYKGFLLSMAFSIKMPPKEFKKLVEKFRRSIPNFLQKLDEDLNEMEKVNEKVFKYEEERSEWIESLPKYADSLDAPELVEFIRSLDKEYYSFSEAERLLDVSRQTLKKYADNGLHGLRCHVVGRVQKLHKADIINFHREKNFADYLPF